MEFYLKLSTFVLFSLWVYYYINVAAILISWVNPDPFNPIVSFLNRITRPYWQWVGRYAPCLKSFEALLGLFLIYFGIAVFPETIETIGFFYFGSLSFESTILNIFVLVGKGAIFVIKLILEFMTIIAIVWFVFTLINPPFNNPIVRMLMMFIDPFISPIQRILPRMKYDISPLILALFCFFSTEYMLIPLNSFVLGFYTHPV